MTKKEVAHKLRQEMSAFIRGLDDEAEYNEVQVQNEDTYPMELEGCNPDVGKLVSIEFSVEVKAREVANV